MAWFFRIEKSFERGFFVDISLKLDKALKKRSNEVQIFESLEDYVEQFSKMVGIKLENLENLFVIFFIILSSILVVFLANKKVFKRLKRLVRTFWFV